MVGCDCVFAIRIVVEVVKGVLGTGHGTNGSCARVQNQELLGLKGSRKECWMCEVV
jgi:hypothetical protein